MSSVRPAVSRRARRLRTAVALLGALLCLLAGQLLLAGPASAHAELVSSTPTNGERLAVAPREVTLRFTETVGLVTGGLQLLDASTGEPIPTPEPVADGSTVRLPMPSDLPNGSYVVNWRVVSADAHPVAGAFSFGVGQDAAAVPEAVAGTGAPWLVSVARWAGYLGFALVAGVLAFTALCWTAGRDDRRTGRILTTGLSLAAASTLVGLLLEGPYVAGAPMWQVFDPTLMGQVAHSGFGAWSQLRLMLYLTLAAVLWGAGGLGSRVVRWGAAVGVVAVAVTFPGTGHAAASDSLLDESVDTVHVLAAGLWVGGLVTLAVFSFTRAPRPGREAFTRFSRLALTSVLVLAATGTVNAVLRLDTPAQLWTSGYGQLLLSKLILVVIVLGAAAASRRAVTRRQIPWEPVRFEATGLVGVLAITAVLSLTAPPSDAAREATGAPPADAAAARTTVTMDLGDDRHAELHVDGTTTTGSRLRLELFDRDQGPLPAKTVSLVATLPERDLGPIELPLARHAAGWHGNVDFPLAGEWKLTLTVEEPDLDAVVTAGTVAIE